MPVSGPARILWVCWVAAWVAIGAVLVVRVARGGGGETVSLHAEGLLSASLAGVRAEVVAVEASVVETVVRVRFEGREDEGAWAGIGGRSYLTLDDGSVIWEEWGQALGRAAELHFGPVPEGRVPGELVLVNVRIKDSPELSVRRDGMVSVGSFTLGITPGLVERTPGATLTMRASSTFGRGTLLVDEVAVSGEGLVVLRGEFAGYSGPELETMMFDTPMLVFADGTEVTHMETRIGGGAEPAGFEIFFRVGRSRGPATLTVVARPPAQGVGSSAPGGGNDGTVLQASVQVTIPQ